MLENTNMYFSVVGELKYYESEIFHALQLKSWSTESIEVLPSIKTLFVLKNFADDSVLKHRRPESDWCSEHCCEAWSSLHQKLLYSISFYLKL